MPGPIADPATGAAADRGKTPAQTNTDLALQRTYLATERTLEAWIRTALSMISFGFTIAKVIQTLGASDVEGLFGKRAWSISGLGYFLVLGGVLALAAATVQQRVRARALYAQGLRREPSVAQAVAVVLCVVGAVAFTALVLQL
jgi:putative membrane protein